MARSKVRTLNEVVRDISRTKRAERKVRRNWNLVTRSLAKDGALVGLPKKGEPEPKEKPKLSVYVRHQRELQKSLRIFADTLKELEIERTALTAAEVEKDDEYNLG